MDEKKSKITQEVVSVICENLGFEEDDVTLDSKLVEDLGADSLDFVELIMTFEEKFDITLSEDQQKEFEHVRTVLDIVKLVDKFITK
jgi:acyl carrier protein